MIDVRPAHPVAVDDAIGPADVLLTALEAHLANYHPSQRETARLCLALQAVVMAASRARPLTTVEATRAIGQAVGALAIQTPDPALFVAGVASMAGAITETAAPLGLNATKPAGHA